MPRAKYGAARHKKRKRLFKKAKGYYGPNSRTVKGATTALLRAGAYAFRDRRARKRDFRRLWIVRLSAACRAQGISYSRFVRALQVSGIELNRKMLSHLAVEQPETFNAVMAIAKENLS